MALEATRGNDGGGEARGAAQFRQGSGGMLAGTDIYMGTTHMRTRGMTPQARSNAINTGGGRLSDRWMSKEQALGEFFQWSDKKQNDFIAQGVVGGQLQLGSGPLEGVKLWAQLVDMAELYGKVGKKVSPLDLLRRYVKAAGGAGGTWVKQGDFQVNTVTGERRYVGPRFKTTTNTQVDLTDPDTARAIATSLFQDMVGRDPRAGELKGFASALHAAEEASPVVQTTTTEFDTVTGEPVGADTVSEGGLTAEGRALIGQNRIKKDPEYGAYQAATTYQGALEQLVYGAPE